jgi:Fic family protein
MEMDGHLDGAVPCFNRMVLEVEMDVGLRTDTLVITPEILRLVSEIDEFKGAWAAIGRISPERLTALRRVATIESIGSSTRIEGARLSDKEVELLLAGLDVKAFASRDEEEVAAYAKTMETVFAHWQGIQLTENHIRQLHRDVLQYSSKDERHRGAYKTLDNHVEAFGPDGKSLGIVFQTATPFDTPRLMTELLAWTQQNLQGVELHPLLSIGLFIVVFLQIHPFQDGNGRLSRILTTLLLLRAGYAYVPYSSLESVIEKTKEAYYMALRRTQRTIRTQTPDWQPWLVFFLNSLQQQKAWLEKKIERERLILGELPLLSVQILELCRERGRVTVAEVAKVTGASRNTIKDHLKALTRATHLEQHGAGRGTWYGLA